MGETQREMQLLRANSAVVVKGFNFGDKMSSRLGGNSGNTASDSREQLAHEEMAREQPAREELTREHLVGMESGPSGGYGTEVDAHLAVAPAQLEPVLDLLG